MTAPCTVHLPIFEGPLDLLLHLIKRNEVQIADIPIAAITDQYLALLDELPELNLDGAGEYLVMAATLTYIKSRMLLPTPVDDDEPIEDPRAELVQQLLEYQRYREVAVALGERQVLDRDVFAREPEPVEPPLPGEDVPLPVREASVGDLLEALRDVLSRLKPPPVHEVAEPQLSIRSCVDRILARFAIADHVEFGELFEPHAVRATVIITFLALLEMIRLRVLRAQQHVRFGPITLALAVDSIAAATERVQDLGPDVWEVERGGEASYGHGDGNR